MICLGRATIEDDDLETEHVPIVSGKIIGGGATKPSTVPTSAATKASSAVVTKPAGSSLGPSGKASAPAKATSIKPAMSVEDYEIDYDDDGF